MVGRLLGLAVLATVLAVGPAPASELGDFGRCLASAGSKLYTAVWCPQCARQEELLGEALNALHPIDCSDPADCEEDDIRALPMWEFGDGSRATGVQTLGQLERRTGCRLDDHPAATTTVLGDLPAGGSGRVREHRIPGGPLIIDVR